MILHIFTPLETWEKNTNNPSLPLLFPIPKERKSQDQGKQRKGPSSEGTAQMALSMAGGITDSLWQGILQWDPPAPKSPDHHHILLEPRWTLVHSPRVGPARAAHWQGVPCSSASLEKQPRDWWELGALVLLGKAKGKKSDTVGLSQDVAPVLVL